MRKLTRTLLTIAIMASALILSSSTSFADDDNYLSPKSDPTVGTIVGSGTFSPLTTFFIDQDVPYLSLSFFKESLKGGTTRYQNLTLKYTWTYLDYSAPGINPYVYTPTPTVFDGKTISELSGDLDILTSLADWGNKELVGTWQIATEWKLGSKDWESGRTQTFEVLSKQVQTPEPASTALFLMGGATMAFIRKRNKRS